METIEQIAKYNALKAQVKALEAEMATLKTAFIDKGLFTQSEVTLVDSAKLKREYPEVYKNCIKNSIRTNLKL